MPSRSWSWPSEDAKVYKLIGPTLIKQDPVEAKSNVNKRLEFITGGAVQAGRTPGRLSGQSGEAPAAGDPTPLPPHAVHAWSPSSVRQNLQACLCS